jgi:Protein of unknown function (DUF4058)
MKSPFPGMDPYIEMSGFWRDFHSRLIGRILEALETVVPPKYRVRTEQREVVELVEREGKDNKSMYPDVGVTGPLTRPKAAGDGDVAVVDPDTAIEPLALRAFIAEAFRETFIEITAAGPERRLVTCIEVLSPTNKRPNSPGWDQYYRKRQALLLGEASLVEIDLLRGGEKMPMLDDWPNSPYTLLVGRWYKEGLCHVWPAHFRKRLPVIPVPLDRPDPDVVLDLQPMIDSIYERSRYGEDIDYTKPLNPPLQEADQSWLQEQLKARQRPT